MKRKGPEQWHAVVLRDEGERLAIACRQLEFRLGYFEGLADGEALAEVGAKLRQRVVAARAVDPRRRLAVLR